MVKQATYLLACCTAVWLASACDDDDGGSGGSGGTTSSSGQGGTGTGGSVQGGGGQSSGPCAETACNDQEPDPGCETCIAAECATEMASCMADTGAGGAGGSTCIGCAEVLGDGSWDDACDASKNLFAAFLGCICGDGTTAGACN
ncbi:MAG: hypothetical protein JRI68_29295 [Deltaproteobacteria bacterium]|nr:hypothetical protein [Deltaproteobacteria bacterium]